MKFNTLEDLKKFSNHFKEFNLNILIKNIQASKIQLETSIHEKTIVQAILFAINTFKTKKKWCYLSLDNHKFLIRVKNKRVHLFLIDLQIYKSLTSTINELYELATGEIFIYKEAIASDMQQLLLYKEYLILDKINKIQKVNPHQLLLLNLVEISSQENNHYQHTIGYIYEKYDIHLLDYIEYLVKYIKQQRQKYKLNNDTISDQLNNDILQKIYESVQLLEKIILLNQVNIFHGDLSYTNIMVKFKNNLTFFHIIDFGNAVDLDTILDKTQIPTSCGFLYSIHDYIKQVNWIRYCSNQNYFFLLKQMDIYAMGKVLKKFIDSLIAELPSLKTHKKIAFILELVNQMTLEDYRKRLTASDLQKWIDTIKY